MFIHNVQAGRGLRFLVHIQHVSKETEKILSNFHLSRNTSSSSLSSSSLSHTYLFYPHLNSKSPSLLFSLPNWLPRHIKRKISIALKQSQITHPPNPLSQRSRCSHTIWVSWAFRSLPIHQTDHTMSLTYLAKCGAFKRASAPAMLGVKYCRHTPTTLFFSLFPFIFFPFLLFFFFFFLVFLSLFLWQKP